MASSYRIFKVFGISIELHITFLFFLVLLLLFDITSLFLWLMVFMIVLIHELVHSLVAIGFKIKVPSILLTPIGGLSNIDVPEDPKKEFLISFAGPFSNIVMAFTTFLLMYLAGTGLLSYNQFFQVFENGKANFLDPAYILSGFIWLNLTLGLFNLLPGFPMDGGRVFRALMAFWMDYITATQVAVQVGKIIAALVFLLGLGALGIFTGSYAINPLTMLIGVFLFFSGGQELQMLKIRHALEGMAVRDLAIPNMRYANESMTLQDFIDNVASLDQDHYPVTDVTGKVTGVLHLEDLRDIRKADVRRINVGTAARRSIDVIDAATKTADKLPVLLSKDFVLVVDSGNVIGYITPAHLLDVARFSTIRKRN